MQNTREKYFHVRQKAAKLALEELNKKYFNLFAFINCSVSLLSFILLCEHFSESLFIIQCCFQSHSEVQLNIST